MAFFANHLSLSLVLITILSSHARDNQFFNKISATGNDVVPKADQPDFLPETENGHGLYSAKLPPSATTTAEEPKRPLHRYLPKNYNPESYVTEPEDASELTNDQNDHFTPEEKAAEYRNTNYNVDDLSSRRRENNFNRAGFGPQGMSDTRSLENGKYFYDINSERYNSNHPYESMKSNYYENGYEFNGGKNSVGGRWSDNGRNNYYYRNGEYEFNGGRGSVVGGYEKQGDEGINENYNP